MKGINNISTEKGGGKQTKPPPRTMETRKQTKTYKKPCISFQLLVRNTERQAI